MRVVRAETLTLEAFAPFGDVISTTGPGSVANQGTAVRFDWRARLSSDRSGARPNLAVFRSMPQQMPFSIRLLERHPRSSQAFLPMIAGRLLISVAPTLPDGTPDLVGLRAFLGVQGQGINYLAGVWHHPIVALDQPAELAMLAWEDGGLEDCVEFALPEIISVE